MLVKLDEEILFEIDDVMIKLLAHDLDDPIAEIKRRLKYIIEHKCDRCFERMEREYLIKMQDDNNIDMIPKNKKERAKLIFSLPYYKDKAMRNKEELERTRLEIKE